MKLCDLKKPFPEGDIDWRVQQAGQKGEKVWALVLAYVTNRAIMNRLDEVCGPENWCNNFVTGPDGGILCGISIKIGEEWVTKWDGAEKTQVEAVKGGLSGAMKRAAVQWGIGRYLYNLDATFAQILDTGKHYQPAKQGKYPAFKWNPPKLPDWALPGSNKKGTPPPEPEPQKTKLATKDQRQKLMDIGANADVELSDIEVREMAAYYRKGEQLTYDEAQDLIDNFETRLTQWIEATREKETA